MRKVKILFLITKSHWGGAAKYIYDLASRIDRENFEVCFAAGGKGPLKEKIEELGFTYFEIKHFERKISFIGEIFSFFEILKIFSQVKPDIIHVNSSKAGGVCGVAAFIYKLSGHKLTKIFTAHGWAFHESRPKWQLFLIRLASRATSLFYDKVICITSFDYNSSLRYRIASKKKLVLIHNGIDTSIKFIPAKKAREKLNLSPDATLFVSLAEWIRNKGIDILIEGFSPVLKNNKNFNLVLIGSGENPDKAKVEEWVEKNNIYKQTVMIDFLPEAARYLKAFDVFVFPSRKEGLSYALMEASLAQLPIIATAVGGNYDIIDSDKTGILIPSGKPEILSKTIEKVMNNLPFYKKMGKRAKEKIENNFSIARMREKTYELYKLK